MEEKICFKNYYKEDLVGILDTDNNVPTIIFLHGFCGNKDENGLFKDCSSYFLKNDLDSFRFDFSGIGESSGDFKNSSLRKQASELNAVIENILKEKPNSRIGVVGFSLGAAVALYSMNPYVSAYSFWSPAFFPNQDMFPRYNSKENFKKISEQGYIEKGNLKVGKELFEDLRNYSSENTLSYISEPVQIIHGTRDPRINYDSSKYASKKLNCPNELVLISDANHSYKNNFEHRNILFKKTSEWFKKHLISD